MRALKTPEKGQGNTQYHNAMLGNGIEPQSQSPASALTQRRQRLKISHVIKVLLMSLRGLLNSGNE